MGNIEMETLIVCKNGAVLLDGIDLVEPTKMCFWIQYDFLTLMESFFRKNLEELCDKCVAYSITTTKNITYNPSKERNRECGVEGKVLVDKRLYEEYKRKIFDFAYTKCSSLAYGTKNEYILKGATELQVRDIILDDKDTYTCFYITKGDMTWNYQDSNIKINKEEQEEKYNEFNKLVEKRKRSMELIKLIGQDVNKEEKVKKLTR